MINSFNDAEIRAAEKALEQALESADSTAWVYAYTEDAVFVGPGAPEVQGPRSASSDGQGHDATVVGFDHPLAQRTCRKPCLWLRARFLGQWSTTERRHSDSCTPAHRLAQGGRRAVASRLGTSEC